MELTQKILKQKLNYNEETGIFSWRNTVENKSCRGKIAGCALKNGYTVIGINGNTHMASKLAWLYVYGVIPKRILKKDGDPNNDSIKNLEILVKKKRIKSLTEKQLKETLYYDENTGLFSWIINSGSRAKIGHIAGATPNSSGYCSVSIDGTSFYAHRLAWLYCYGYDPIEIDHINHIRTDNRISNLREVTRRENSKNLSKRKINTSGTTGVYWCNTKLRWYAKIGVKGKAINLGSFVNKDEAVIVRKKAEILYRFHTNHGT